MRIKLLITFPPSLVLSILLNKLGIFAKLSNKEQGFNLHGRGKQGDIA